MNSLAIIPTASTFPKEARWRTQSDLKAELKLRLKDPGGGQYAADREVFGLDNTVVKVDLGDWPLHQHVGCQRKGDWWQSLTPTPSDIAHQAVEEARWILDLAEGWNEDGAPAYQESEMDRLRDFLVAFLEEGRAWGIPNKAPDINPAAAGGIDLSWDSPEISMAINVSAESGITFYYEREGGLAAKGWWIFEG